jgi:hypothetical protein
MKVGSTPETADVMPPNPDIGAAEVANGKRYEQRMSPGAISE